MSTMYLSGSKSLTMVASSAPLPIPMHLSSPEQTTNRFPEHLSPGPNDAFQVGKVTEEGARIALPTTDS